MNRSDSIGQLAAALAAAQGQMANARKDAANPFYKSVYADLSAIVDAIKAPLSKNGIAYVQTTDIADGVVIVETTLLHASGEWLSSHLRMRPVKDDPQGIGSALTYARRYGLQAIVGLAAEDDDGNEASGNPAQAGRPSKAGSVATRKPTQISTTTKGPERTETTQSRDIPATFRDVKEMLEWGHRVTGLSSKEMFALLNVENMLAIVGKHGSLTKAAEVLLANVPEEGGE